MNKVIFFAVIGIISIFVSLYFLLGIYPDNMDIDKNGQAEALGLPMAVSDTVLHNSLDELNLPYDATPEQIHKKLLEKEMLPKLPFSFQYPLDHSTEEGN